MLPLFLFFYPITITIVATDISRCYLQNDQFSLSWVHSVERERWIETYQVEKNGFRLTGSKFKTFGAGTPNDGVVVKNNEGFIDYKVDLKIPRIHWIISRNVASELLTKDTTWKVYQLFDDYTEMDFSVQRMALWKFLFKDSCYDKFKPRNTG